MYLDSTVLVVKSKEKFNEFELLTENSFKHIHCIQLCLCWSFEVNCICI